MNDDPVRRRGQASGGARAAARRTDAHRPARRTPRSAPPTRNRVSAPWHLGVIAAWGGVWAVSLSGGTAIAWHFCVQGALLITRGGAVVPTSHWPKPGGLHLYANYPDLQMGPLTFWTASVLRRWGRHDGTVGAQVFMALLGLVVVYSVERAVRLTRPDLGAERTRRMMLLSGLVLAPFWIELSVRFAHLDDVLALTFAAAAVWAAAAGRGVAAGLALGAAVDAKPWAAAFLVLAAALPRGRRIPAAVAACAVIALAWLPFVLADPHSVGAAGFSMPIAPTSGLRVLGLGGGRTPSWDRVAQVVLGAGLASVAVRRGQWPAVLLLAVGVRLALDPNTYSYYTTGIVVAAVVWDCVGSPRTTPLWSLAIPLLLDFDRVSGASTELQSQFRLGLVAALAAGLWFEGRSATVPDPDPDPLAAGPGGAVPSQNSAADYQGAPTPA